MGRYVISSGHSLRNSGAIGYLNEVMEARRVVPRVAHYMRQLGHTVLEYHDNTGITVSENLNNIVRYHNSQTRDVDISIHFNAFSTTNQPRGTEVLYYDQSALAARVSKAISDSSGLINRGAKRRTDLYFLNSTARPAILIEVCFVDSSADVAIYNSKFEQICQAIAHSIVGAATPTPPPPTPGLPYGVRVTVDQLNIRSGPGSNYPIVGSITDRGSYTIVEEANGSGASKWGKLKSGAGWISLDFVEVTSTPTPPPPPPTGLPYGVRVTVDQLNIRSGPGSNYPIVGSITDRGSYTIVEEANGTGASKWGKLKSGAGWISLDYCQKI